MLNSRIQSWLNSANGFLFSLYVIVAAFCTYSCMYAFRKPFAAAGFEGGPEMFGVDYKSALVISQVVGYMLSKFIGIKVVSEMGKSKRAIAILVLIGIAQSALFFFGLVPEKLKFIFLFLNGIPLGMVWGLVFSYLEGRRYTEFMGAGLCASFIFASGFVKTVGKTLVLDYGVSEYWMPFATGAIFALPLIFFVWMLAQIPDPTAEDEQLRTRREPMNAQQRKDFFKTFAPGLILLVVVYMFLTAFRDLRDNYMANILDTLGYGEEPMIFTTTEVPVTLGVLGLLALIMFIKDNRRALLVNHAIIFIGIATVGISTVAYKTGMLDPIVWIMITGFGAYMAYIPFNCILFERLIASFSYVSTATFLIYVADSFGYLGSVGTLMYKNYSHAELSWLDFFVASNYVLAIFGGVLTLSAMVYFKMKRA